MHAFAGAHALRLEGNLLTDGLVDLLQYIAVELAWKKTAAQVPSPRPRQIWA